MNHTTSSNGITEAEIAEKEYVTLKVAAALMSITPGTLRNKISVGEITAEHGMRVVFGRRLFNRAKLVACIEANVFDRRKAKT